MAIDDGGPAFPVKTIHIKNDSIGKTQTATVYLVGMSLRDYFAAKATGSDIDAVLRSGKIDGRSEVQRRARARYVVADVMIAERKIGGAS